MGMIPLLLALSILDLGTVRAQERTVDGLLVVSSDSETIKKIDRSFLPGRRFSDIEAQYLPRDIH